MIENAVASTLMRFPVSELNALRKVFMASPGGLSLEGFVAAMLPPEDTSNNFRRQQRSLGRRPPRARSRQSCTSDLSGDTPSGNPHSRSGHHRNSSGKKSSTSSRGKKRRGRRSRPGSTTGRKGSAGLETSAGRVDSRDERLVARRNASRVGRGGEGARAARRGLAGCSMSEEEKVLIVTDLVELFQQVDHNGDKVMEWEEFTEFVIDQVLALAKETPLADRLKVRSLGSLDTPSVARVSVRKVRYNRELGCIFACVGPAVQVLNPVLLSSSDATREGALKPRVDGLFAHATIEETQGFEVGTSAALSEEEGRRRPLHGANPSKHRDGAGATVFAMDIKHVKALKLLVVLRSDLTLAFFSADSYVRVGLVKTPSQQYVLEHSEATGMAFTSGCDGNILSFAIDTQNEMDQPIALATATMVGVLRRHRDVVQDMLAVNGTEAEGGPRLVSCGLDRGVHVWNIAKGAFAQSKFGNRAAIRSLAFDPGDNLLLGAGVEGEVLVWDLWGKLGSPLFRLQGHRSPILSVACAAGKGRAASLDENGKIILWDTRRNTSVDVSERYLCLTDCSDTRPMELDIISDDRDDYLRWSHIGVSVVTAGRYMRIYDAVDPRVSEPPLGVALYSPNCVSFITCNGPHVTLWDACTGKAVRTGKAMEGDIVRACLDSGERRLVLASSIGEIAVYGFLQGICLATMSPGHDGPVSGLAYVPEDKVIVTGGWDRCLKVYDEVPREGDPPLLRQVDGAHSSDINVLSVSQRLGLIASGSADGSCRVWDFQFLSPEGACNIGEEVLCMVFLKPYPLLAVGDSGGCISIIPVRQWQGHGAQNSVLLRFVNDQEAKETIEGPAAVTCITYRPSPSPPPSTAEPATSHDEGDRTPHAGANSAAATASGIAGVEARVLYSGDDQGTVRAWDIGEFLVSVGCHTVPEESLPRSKNNYDPRRRFYRQAETSSEEVETAASAAKRKAPELRQSSGDFASAVTTRCETRPVTDAPSALPLKEVGGSVTSNSNDNDSDLEQDSHKHAEAEARGSGAMSVAHRSDRGRGSGELNKRTSTTTKIAEEVARGGVDDGASGLALVGTWKPHSEAVVSLQVIEDPACLLTASRDRSVKLRALPDRQTFTGSSDPVEEVSRPNTRATTAVGETLAASIEDPRKANSIAGDDIGNDIGSPSVFTAAAATSSNERILGSPASANKARSASGGGGGSSVCSGSSSATPAKLPQHGYDLSTLTLGRIGDGFRRDVYRFPVDVKGRGEGRAAEARAVLQAIEEIERRKAQKRRQGTATEQARDSATPPAAAALPTLPLASSRMATPPTTTTHDKGDGGQQAAPELPLAAASAPDAEKPQISDSIRYSGSKGAAEAPVVVGKESARDSGGLRPAATVGPVGGPPGLLPRKHVAESLALCANPASSSLLSTSAPKPSTTARIGSALNLTRTVRVPSLNAEAKNAAVKPRGHGDKKSSVYENMEAERLRLKNLEASSKAAVKCADAALAIKELLEPTPFLMSQMPDALSSYRTKPKETSRSGKHSISAGPEKPPELSTLRPRNMEERCAPAAKAATEGQRQGSIPQSSDFSTEKRRPTILSFAADGAPSVEHCAKPEYFSSSLTEEAALSASGPGTGAGNVNLSFVEFDGAEPNLGPRSDRRDDGTVLGASWPGDVRCDRKGKSSVDEMGERPRPNLGTGGGRGLDGGLYCAVGGDGPGAPPPERMAERIEANGVEKTSGETGAQRGPDGDSLRCALEDDASGNGWKTEMHRGKKRNHSHGGRPRACHHTEDGFVDDYQAVTAKVSTRRSPRRKLPAYLSTSSRSCGAASRWGALTKAHLEFHRLGTAGLLSSLSCPSLRRHFGKNALGSIATAQPARLAANVARIPADIRRRGLLTPPSSKRLVPTDLDDMARRHARAQEHWKRRVDAFAAEMDATGGNKTRRRLQKIGRSPGAAGGVLPDDRENGRHRAVLARNKEGGPQQEADSSRSAPAATAREVQQPRHQEAAGEYSVEDADEVERAPRVKTHYGPYSRDALCALWKAFDRAKMFGSKVDARLLFQDPFMKDNTRYRKQLMEVLCSSTRAGPIVLSREEALKTLLPLLDHAEITAFLTYIRRTEAELESGRTEALGKLARGHQTDPEKLRELRHLFDLYDVDQSGYVDTKEIVAALKDNYSATQVAAGMADNVTEKELAALVTNLSRAGQNRIVGDDAEGAPPGNSPTELNFDEFVRLFAGVF